MPQVSKEFTDLVEARNFQAKLPGFCRGVINQKNNGYQVLFQSRQGNPDDHRNKYEKRIDELIQAKLNRKLREA